VVTVVTQRASRRERLLSAASAVFVERGVAAATVDEITRRAGVAKGSFYLEFQSKDLVVAALQERFVDELLEKASTILGREHPDLWSMAYEFVDTMVDFDLANRKLLGALLRQTSPSDTEVLSRGDNRLQDMMANGIRLGTASGVFRVEDPETVAAFLTHGLHGVLHSAIAQGQKVDRVRIKAAIRQIVGKVLAPTDPPE
jgi:AcrR family transcriptional regulator